jgi:hypothetical protein
VLFIVETPVLKKKIKKKSKAKQRKEKGPPGRSVVFSSKEKKGFFSSLTPDQKQHRLK